MLLPQRNLIIYVLGFFRPPSHCTVPVWLKIGQSGFQACRGHGTYSRWLKPLLIVHWWSSSVTIPFKICCAWLAMTKNAASNTLHLQHLQSYRFSIQNWIAWTIWCNCSPLFPVSSFCWLHWQVTCCCVMPYNIYRHAAYFPRDWNTKHIRVYLYQILRSRKFIFSLESPICVGLLRSPLLANQIDFFQISVTNALARHLAGLSIIH